MRLCLTTLLPTERAAGFIWWPFDVDELTIEAVWQTLAETEMLRGFRLETVAGDDRDTRIIVKRTPTIVGRRMIGAVWPLDHLTLVDPAATPETPT